MTPEPPNQFTLQGSELFALCARQRRGELVIWRLSVGRTNAEWVADVFYVKPTIAPTPESELPFKV